MPELPEVETVRRSLETFFPAGPILACSIAYSSLLVHPKASEACFRERILGQEIIRVDRRGKYLIFPFATQGGMVVHLGMTGRLLKKTKEALPTPHTHIIWDFQDRALHYEDTRRFGRIYAFTEDPYTQAPLSALGPEPLSEDFTPQGLYDALRGRKAPIKALLLNQHLVAGLGNIYVDEVLFQAGIRPGKAGGRLSRKEAQRLVKASKETLAEAVRLGGSSIRDYRDADGASGSFQTVHKVYGRAGQPCVVCATPLSKKVVGGRTSVYCSHCQKS